MLRTLHNWSPATRIVPKDAISWEAMNLVGASVLDNPYDQL
jgi:hypothetical protein